MALKVPMRRCIGCGQSREKKQLIRIVRSQDGKILADRTGRANGRGAYLCSDPDCLEKAVTKKALSRAFRTAEEPAAYEQLREELRKGEDDAG